MRIPVYTIITGASEGLGKALAIECARRKMNLILIALPGSGLQCLAHFISRNFNVETIAIEKDLCHDQACYEVYNQVKEKGCAVNMLINNAGIGSTLYFEDGSAALYEKQIRLNVLATTLMTKLFLPLLKQHPQSYILNVASMAAFFHIPKKNVYGATKSFIYSFSKSLRTELKKNGIQVSVLCPGGMNTNIPLILMNRNSNWFSRISVMNPEDVVLFAIEEMLRGKDVIIPGRVNRFYLLLDKCLPKFFKNILLQNSMKKMDSKDPLADYLVPKPVIISP